MPARVGQAGRLLPVALAAPVALFLGLFFVAPMALALGEAASPEAWRWVADDYARGRIVGAAGQAVLSLAVTMAVAAPLAWLHHRWRIPGSRGLLAAHAATFALPVFVVVGGLQAALGRAGWSDRLLGLDVLDALGPWGRVAVANAYYNTGLAAVLLHAALARRPRRLEEAAATLGAPPRQVWRRVTEPLLRPAVLATSLLVLLFCLGSFGVVLLLGGGEVETLDTLLYANLRGAFPRTDRAAALAVLQLAVQASALAGVLLLERRAARFAAEPTRLAPPAPTWATAVAWLAAAAWVLPLVGVLLGGFQLAGEWSLDPWRALLGGPGHLAGFGLGRAVALTIAYAAAAVAGAVLLTLMLGHAPGRAARVVEAVAFLPLGTSSVVLGFAFLLAFAVRGWLPLIGSPWGIVAAHTLVAFPFVARTLLPALRGLDQRMMDAAATLGAGPVARLLRVELPAVRGPLAAACAFAAALSLGDYGASLILMTPDTMSVSVWIGRHGGPGAFDPLARAQSLALAGLLLALTAACGLAAFAWRPRRRPA